MERAKELYQRILKNKEAEIDRLIEEQRSEAHFLDFKQSADATVATGRRLHDTDLKNLAKAICGFANSEGGIIVWGVVCTQDRQTGADVATAKAPIANPQRLASLLNDAVSKCTVPPVDPVHSEAVVAEGETSGFVVTYIPQSLRAPHQLLSNDGNATGRYFIRAGSQFVAAPHAVLAGLFGRRPSPKISTNLHMERGHVTQNDLMFAFSIILRNDGLVVAEDLFVSFHFSTKSNGISIDSTPIARWPLLEERGNWSFMCPPEFRLAPGAQCRVVLFQINNPHPIFEPLQYRLVAGCRDAEPSQFDVTLSVEEFNAARADMAQIKNTVETNQALIQLFRLPMTS